MQINSLNNQNCVPASFTDNCDTIPMDHIEAMIGKVLEDARNTCDSVTELALVNQLTKQSSTSHSAIDVVNELISSCPNSPYIGFYHFMKGTMMLLDDSKTLSSSELEAGAAEIVSEMNEAIRLNEDFADAYYIRGIAYGLSGDHDLGYKDLNTAIEMGSRDARHFYENIIADQF